MEKFNLDRFSSTTRFDNHDALLSLDSNQDNVFTPKSFRQVDRDYYLLPLVLDAKYRLDAVKTLQYVFLRLKANLNFHLRKKISAFKLARVLQNTFFNVEAEAFYVMKIGIREPSEMPFTKQIGFGSSMSISQDHSNYEIVQMYTNGSLEDISDMKNINRTQIEEIYKGQQLFDTLDYIHKNLIHTLKLEAFENIKGQTIGLSARSFQSGRIRKVENIQVDSISTLDGYILKYFDSQKHSQVASGLKKLESGLSNHLKASQEESIYNLQSPMKQILASISKKRAKSFDSNHKKLNQTPVEDRCSSVPTSLAFLMNEEVENQTQRSKLLTATKSQKKYISSGNMGKDSHRNYVDEQMISPFNDLFIFSSGNKMSPIHIHKGINESVEEENSDSSKSSSLELKDDFYGRYGFNFESAINDAHSLGNQSSSKPHFGPGKIDLYIRYQPGISQIVNLYSGVQQDLKFTAFQNIKENASFESSPLSVKKKTKPRHKIDQNQILNFEVGIEKLSRFLKSKIFTELFEFFGHSEFSDQNEDWWKALNERVTLLQTGSEPFDTCMSLSKFEQMYGSSGGFISTERELKFYSTKGLASRLESIAGKFNLNHLKFAFKQLCNSQKLYTFGSKDLRKMTKTLIFNQTRIQMFVNKLENVKIKILKDCFLNIQKEGLQFKERTLKLEIFADVLESIFKVHAVDNLAEAFAGIKHCNLQYSLRYSLSNLNFLSSRKFSADSLYRSPCRWSYESLDMREDLNTNRLITGGARDLSLRIIFGVLGGYVNNSKALKRQVFSRIKVSSNHSKLTQVQETYRDLIDTHRNLNRKYPSKALNLISKLQILDKIYSLKFQSLGFNTLRRYYEKKDTSNSQDLLKLAKIEDVVRCLSMSMKLDTQLSKVKAFYRLANAQKRHHDDLAMLSQRSRQSSINHRNDLKHFISLQKLESVFKLHNLRSFAASFTLLKEKTREPKKELNTKLAFQSKITPLFGRILNNKIPKILKLKAWNKLKDDYDRGVSPRTELRLEKRKLKQKSAVYFVNVLRLIEKFHKHSALNYAFYTLKYASKAQEVEMLNEKITEDHRIQEITRVLLKGLACLDKVGYHAQKKNLEIALSSLKVFAQDKKIKTQESAKKLVDCIDKLQRKSITKDAILTLRKNFESAKKISEDQFLSSQRDSSDLPSSSEFRRKIYKESKRGVNQLKLFRTNHPQPDEQHLSLSSYLNFNNTNASLLAEKERDQRSSSKYNIVPPTSRDSHDSNDKNNISLDSPTLMQPLIETPDDYFGASPLNSEISTTKHNETFKMPSHPNTHRIQHKTTLQRYNKRPKSFLTLRTNRLDPKLTVREKGHIRNDSQSSDKENVPVLSVSSQEGRVPSARSTVKHDYNIPPLQKAPLRKDQSGISSRLYNIVNFSFKPEATKYNLRLEDVKCFTESTQNEIKTNELSYVKSTEKTLPIGYPEDFSSSDINNVPLPPLQENRRILNEHNIDKSQDVLPIKIVYSNNQRSNINPRKSVNNDIHTHLKLSHRRHHESLHLDKPPSFDKGSFRKNSLPRGGSISQLPEKANHSLIYRNSVRSNMSNLEDLAAASQLSSKRNVRKQSTHRDSCDQCDFCGKELSCNDDYTVYRPVYSNKGDESMQMKTRKANSMIVDDNKDKDLKSRILKRIFDEKITYLESEKTKSLKNSKYRLKML